MNSALFPEQKLATNRKNKQWRIDCVRHIVNDSINEQYDDIKRMVDNYNLINSQLNQEDYKNLCQNLGVSQKEGKKYVEAYNKAHNIYSTFKGEELNRSFSFSVMNLSPNAANEVLRDQEIDYKRYMNAVWEKGMKKVAKQADIDRQIKQQTLDPQKGQAQMEQFEKDLEERYKKILDVEELKAKHENALTAKEKTVNKLMKIMMYKENIAWLKNETFGDAIVAGKELIEIKVDKNINLPTIRQLNPLNVYYHKSPDTPFIQDSDYAGYKELMTIGQVIDMYGNRMTNKQLDQLKQYNYNSGGSYGTGDSMFHKRGDSKASSWKSVNESGMYPSGKELDPYGAMIIEGKIKGIPHSSSNSDSNVNGPGLYSDQSGGNKGYIVVHTVYWKSYRKVYKYSFINEYGKMTEEIVDEEFYVPTHAKNETYQNKMFDKKRTRKVWYDKEGNYNSVEEHWIPETWTGTMLNNDIFLDIEPVEHAYQSLLNPYESKLPIHGFIYNGRNAAIVSPIDRVKPWQKLYYVIMSKVLRMISQDRGVLTFLNTLMIDKEFGLKRTLQMAEDQGLIPYNPMAYSKGGTFHNQLKVADQLDATNSSTLNHYIQLLQFVEGNIEESVGMSPQRLAQASSEKTATDNQRQTAHSMNITEALYIGHEVLWEKIMQSYMEMLVSALNESVGKFRGFLNDEEIAILDLNLISLEDEYLLRIANSNRNNKVLQQGYELAHALIQNDKASLSTLIGLLQTTDLNEFKAEVRAIEKNIEKREQQQQEKEREIGDKRLQLELQNREDIQKAKLDETYLKGKLDQEKEHIRGKYLITSYNLNNDADGNGVADIFEREVKYEELLANLRKEESDNEMRKSELLQRQQEHQDNLEAQRNKIEADKRAKEADQRLKAEDIKVKKMQKKQAQTS